MSSSTQKRRPTVGAKKLKKWRILADLTQAKAARLADVSPALWSQWESFQRSPCLKNSTMLVRLTAGFVSLQDLLTELDPDETESGRKTPAVRSVKKRASRRSPGRPARGAA